jgi:hypothetical protein
VQPGDDLALAVNQAPANSTVCIAPGTYQPTTTLHPASGVTVTGTGRSRADVRITTSDLNIIFDLGLSTGVTIHNLTISGAVNACPGVNCGPTGEGITGGFNVSVINVRLSGNGRSGIGGVKGQLTVRNSRVDHNGAAITGPDYVSAGIKSVNPIYVDGTRVDDNNGNGIHCHRDCGAFTVTNSDVEYNTLTGIHVELGRGPTLIENNIVQHNNTLNWKNHAGIQGTDSQNQTIRYNQLGYNGGNGIHVWQDARANTTGYPLANVVIYGNNRKGDAVGNCRLEGVTCGQP